MNHNPESLRALLPYCTKVQKRYINAVISKGSVRNGAKLCEVNSRTVSFALAAVRKKAAKSGWSPEHDYTHPVPDGYNVRGVSTLYGNDGAVKIQWVKSQADADRREEIMQAAFEAFSETLPRYKPGATPKKGCADLATCYVLTDFHLGMLSWAPETGADWDIKIAEDLLVNWFAAAILSAPSSGVGILAQLGDLLHADNLLALTPAGGNVLDADSRLQKVVRVAIRSMRRIIDALLGKHPHVHILMCDANHDPVGSIWLREWLAVFYENEPRVTVDLGADGYYCYEHGNTSLFFHHGHKRKPESVDDVFAAKFREVFGRTKHSYAHMGHMHFLKARETPLMIVEQHRTMAAPDAYASRGGFISGRSASAITYHKRFGEVGRVTLTPEMVSGGAN